MTMGWKNKSDKQLVNEYRDFIRGASNAKANGEKDRAKIFEEEAAAVRNEVERRTKK